MKKIFLIILFVSFQSFAQAVGESGLAFLKHGFGARNIAMGDFAVASANDLTALNYNPALLSKNEFAQIGFSHNSIFQDLSSQFFGVSLKAFGLPFAIGANTTNISNIEIRTKPGEAEGTFNAHYFFGSLSTAYQINSDISAGATVKLLYESLYSDESTGLAFDFGLSYKDMIDGLTLGASIKNIGSMNSLRNKSTELPNELNAGAAYDIYLGNIRVTAAGGVREYLKEEKAHAHFGGEFSYKENFFVRFGYLSGYESKNISTGFGINWSSLNIDYAYVPIKYGLGDSHIISLTYSFK
ncbi:MAG: hypothetical protein FD143_721 [Ignavibacteria bacterium]|nr:MAG: hypothetical protein FD143_721 [Ignavibacteria bacterium]KAF0161334.1 MAG: hypothetical protein FD188_922 [Ignavibacteria bacterium]